MDDWAWLEDWYLRQCDGEWEHQKGVTIESCDNPGWLVTIEPRTLLKDEILTIDGEPPGPQNGNAGGESWLECKVVDGKFVGAGDARRLRQIIHIFRQLIEARR